MTFAFNGVDDVRSFVECCTIHDNDGVCGCRWQKCFSRPRQKDIGVDVTVPQVYREQCKPDDGTDSIEPSLLMPIVFTVTPCSPWGVTMRSGSINGETALIKVHNGALLDIFVPPHPRLEPQTMHDVCFRMPQSFF